MRPRPLDVTAIVGFVATALVLVVPSFHLAYEAEQVGVVLETTKGLVGLLVAVLLYGRYARSRRLNDLVLVYALLLSGIAAFLVALGSDLHAPSSLAITWLPMLTRAAAATALLVAVSCRPRRIHPRNPVAVVIASAGLTVVTLAALVEMTQRVGPPRSFPRELEDVPDSLASGPGGVLVMCLVLVALHWAVAVSLRNSRRDLHDPLMAAIAVGTVLAGYAWLHFFLKPIVHVAVLHVGDVLHVGFHAALLFGAIVEIRSYWRQSAREAVNADRRRIARELHDGIIQELSFIHSHATALARGAGDPHIVESLEAASRRALADSRQALRTLSEEQRPPVRETDIVEHLRDVAATAAARACVALSFDAVVRGAARRRPDVAQALARVVREAVTNAGRHADATAVQVFVEARRRWMRVRVVDNGSGFDAAFRREGFGLSSIREEVERVGGTLTVRSQEHVEGTTVEATL